MECSGLPSEHKDRFKSLFSVKLGPGPSRPAGSRAASFTRSWILARRGKKYVQQLNPGLTILAEILDVARLGLDASRHTPGVLPFLTGRGNGGGQLTAGGLFCPLDAGCRLFGEARELPSMYIHSYIHLGRICTENLPGMRKWPLRQLAWKNKNGFCNSEPAPLFSTSTRLSD